jgi:hypothetical protein
VNVVLAGIENILLVVVPLIVPWNIPGFPNPPTRFNVTLPDIRIEAEKFAGGP